MADWEDLRTAFRAYNERRAQRQSEAAERAVVLDHLRQQRIERLERQKQGKHALDAASCRPGDKILTVEEIRQCNQSIREYLEKVATGLRLAEIWLCSAERSFTRAAWRLENAEEHFTQAESDIERLSSEQVEERIEIEHLSPPPDLQ